MELTATLLCIRVVLKDNDLLSLSYDSILLIIYMFFRNFILAKFTVYDAKLFNFFKNDFKYRVVNIVSILKKLSNDLSIISLLFSEELN